VFTADETAVCRRLIGWALEEDFGARGDLTSQAVIPTDLAGKAVFVARSPGVLAGLPALDLVLAAVDPHLALQALKNDGDLLQANDQIAIVSGPMRSLLTAERTALNFLQHLSGIATLTRRYVDVVAGLPVQILDTRKTIPGWRLLAKYAVRQGGGHNHRMGLYDGILIKDNHLAARGTVPEAVSEAVRLAREKFGTSVPVEIEVEDFAQLGAALRSRPDIVLLDNMPAERLREAVRRRDTIALGVQLEASGGVNLTTVRGIAEAGVDRISVGALTHSAPALDIALDYLR
jgi:nicotinate-nucleotide pyrophosphorylase (carboxylating)